MEWRERCSGASIRSLGIECATPEPPGPRCLILQGGGSIVAAEHVRGAHLPYDPGVIRYEDTLYRPPSEANSLILQATIGCSYNECSFCGMYRNKRFRVRPLEELLEEIDWVKRSGEGAQVRKVFLADGDALVAKPAFIAKLLDALNEAFPKLRRISCYASPQSLQVRSVEQMTDLRERGLTLYYLGIESGHDPVLEHLTKGVDAAEMVRVADKATAAGVALSTMILLGSGGRAGSEAHARASAEVVSAIQPRFVSTLVMTPVDGTPLGDEDARGEFEHLTPLELAHELRHFLAALKLSGSIFRSNHASNYLTLAGSLPKDQDKLVAALDRVIDHPENAPFRPKWLRSL
jgi:radical SAM superfamily enzyme YgiQ (UPF0313 family)